MKAGFSDSSKYYVQQMAPYAPEVPRQAIRGYGSPFWWGYTQSGSW
jgi:hypothetical protein